MRLFIGLPVPSFVREELSRVRLRLKRINGRMSFVSDVNFHITLLFIGDSDASVIDNLLSTIVFNKFSVMINGVSYFPNKERIRVIHSPVISDDLLRLHNIIANLLGINDKQFVPHITIARVKYADYGAVVKLCDSIKINESFTINSFNLYSSTLTPNGPIYKLIKSYKLQ